MSQQHVTAVRAAVVLGVSAALLAGCAGGTPAEEGTTTAPSASVEPSESLIPSASETIGQPGPATVSATPGESEAGVPTYTEDDLLDTEGWQEFSSDFIEFDYPADWEVAEDPEWAGIMQVRDEAGVAVARFYASPFVGDADGPVYISSVNEVGRLSVDTDAEQDQVLFTAVTEPNEEAPERVRRLHLMLVDPDQAAGWQDQLASPLGFKQTDEDWGRFESTDEFFALDGEAVSDPSDEQIAAFMRSDRYLKLLTTMESVGE